MDDFTKLERQARAMTARATPGAFIWPSSALAGVTIISMAHGRLTSDLVLFALIGLAAGVYEAELGAHSES